MKTTFGIFADWLVKQIPDFVRSEVSKAVSEIPRPKDGKTGPKGVSVVDAEVALDGNLVLKLSDGSIIDAGEIVQQGKGGNNVFVSGNAWQVTVSATAPDNPQLNQLWLDIS